MSYLVRRWRPVGWLAINFWRQHGRTTRHADSDPTTHILDVPGARLYYERRGSGPLLLMMGVEEQRNEK
jgi:hypothetical protein